MSQSAKNETNDSAPSAHQTHTGVMPTQEP